MSAISAKPIEGHVVPGSLVMPYLGRVIVGMPERVQRSFVTNIPYGPPIEEEKTQAKPQQPLATGDDRNPDIMKALQKLMGGQQQGGEQQKPIAQSLPGYRDWR